MVESTTAQATIPATAESDPADGAAPPTAADDAPLIEADLLVEEVSIDGMCGVY